METFEITEDNLDTFSDLLGEDLSDDIKRLYFRGIGVTDDEGNPLGALVCELQNADSEEERGSKICFLSSGSKEVFNEIDRLYKRHTVEMEEVLQSEYELTDEIEVGALREAGFSSKQTESETIILSLKDLASHKLARGKKPPDHVKSLGTLSILQYRDTIKQIIFMGHTGILEDIAYLPMHWFDVGISSCVMSGDRALGLFLIRRTPSGVLIPVFYSAYGAESKVNLLYMLQYTIREAIGTYPPETPVMVMRRNSFIRALTDRLLPDHAGAEVYYGTRKEK